MSSIHERLRNSSANSRSSSCIPLIQLNPLLSAEEPNLRKCENDYQAPRKEVAVKKPHIRKRIGVDVHAIEARDFAIPIMTVEEFLSRCV